MVESTQEPSGSATTRPRKAASRPAGPPNPVEDKPAKKAPAKKAAKKAPAKKAAGKKAPAKKAAKKAPAKKAAGKPNLTTAALMAQAAPADV